MTTADQPYDLSRHNGHFSASFKAMASSCELLIATEDEHLAHALAKRSLAEVKRIERKFSRYQKDNLCYAINNANGASTPIDQECHRLLQFAQTCYELSEGMFDLSSGVLRRAWQFDCSDRIPEQQEIEAILPLVGWQQVIFDKRQIQMKAGMEIDFGGIGKEYAVSRVTEICQQFLYQQTCKQQTSEASVLINLGGDIQITRPQKDRKPWIVGIENDDQVISICEGALATSGDSKRYLLKEGKRYSHILNPKTGWPVEQAPASITTTAPLCVQAGCLATLALLQGKNAEDFLKEQDVHYWCTR